LDAVGGAQRGTVATQQRRDGGQNAEKDHGPFHRRFSFWFDLNRQSIPRGWRFVGLGRRVGRHLALGTWHLALGTWHLALGGRRVHRVEGDASGSALGQRGWYSGCGFSGTWRGLRRVKTRKGPAFSGKTRVARSQVLGMSGLQGIFLKPSIDIFPVSVRVRKCE
jgi:hypothetical protein